MTLLADSILYVKLLDMSINCIRNFVGVKLSCPMQTYSFTIRYSKARPGCNPETVSASGRILFVHHFQRVCQFTHVHTPYNVYKMSSLADELLQDFEDSGSEGEEQQKEGLFQDDDESRTGLNGHAVTIKGTDGGGMELDGDEEEVDEDEEMAGMNNSALDKIDDEEEAKARVEKMQLKDVEDVRSVAGLMKTLEPILEVSISLYSF